MSGTLADAQAGLSAYVKAQLAAGWCWSADGRYLLPPQKCGANMTSFAFSPTFATGVPQTGGVGPSVLPGISSPTDMGTTSGLSAGAQAGLGALGQAGCNAISNPTLKSLCLAGVNIVTGGTGSEPGTSNADPGTSNSAQSLASDQGCPAGYTKVGSTCVNVANALPGGQPLTTPAGGTAVAKGDQFTAGWVVAPTTVTEYRRKCPRSFVLGFDGNCYHKAMIPNKFRRWPKAPRPPVTRSDVKAIRKAASAKKRVDKLAKDVGLHVYKTARGRSRK